MRLRDHRLIPGVAHGWGLMNRFEQIRVGSQLRLFPIIEYLGVEIQFASEINWKTAKKRTFCQVASGPLRCLASRWQK
jgi:hypothetical protein